MSVLVVMEQSGGMSLETLAAGQQLAHDLGAVRMSAVGDSKLVDDECLATVDDGAE